MLVMEFKTKLKKLWLVNVAFLYQPRIGLFADTGRNYDTWVHAIFTISHFLYTPTFYMYCTVYILYLYVYTYGSWFAFLIPFSIVEVGQARRKTIHVWCANILLVLLYVIPLPFSLLCYWCDVVTSPLVNFTDKFK